MPGKLTFGYLCDFRNPPQWQRDWSDVYEETLDFIAWSETVGFEGAWVPEHHGARDGYIPTPNVILAAIAARTKRLRLGSAVGLAPLYHPVRFAEECAVLDILSRGRIEMALGIGYRRKETDAFGADFTRRGAMFDEFLQIVRRLWAGETVTFEGKHYQVRGARISPRSPRGQVPLYIGGFAEKALARVAEYGDGYFGNPEVVDVYRQKLAELGKDPDGARVRFQSLFVTVAREPAAAMDELAPYFHHVNNTYGEWMAEDKAIGLDDAKLEAMDLASFKASGILEILTPEQAVDRFGKLRDRYGVEHIMMMLPPGLPPAKFMPYAEVFARGVIPAFA